MKHCEVELINFMGTDLTVVNAARVSFARHKTKLDDKDRGLISYLARNQHWTPFAHPQAQFRITVPIFVAAQLKRHVVGFALNEVSRRYVYDAPEFCSLDWREKPEGSIKQGSGGTIQGPKRWGLDQDKRRVESLASEVYEDMLEQGAAPEQARAILPQTMFTSWYWTGSLYAWANLCRQRLDSHAQAETRRVAEKIQESMLELFPVSWKALVCPI